MNDVGNPRLALYTIVGAACAIGLFLWLSADSYPELRELAHGTWDQETYIDYFGALAKEKGGAYAFEVLRRVDAPPGINVHTVGHRIGDILYAQEGIEGLRVCTPEFRDACAHSVVIGLFIDYGAAALSMVTEACATAPGGTGATALCFHGVGHGILAHLNYDFEKAIDMCGAADTQSPEGEARTHRFVDGWQECIGGAVMELIQGNHDPLAQERAQPKYLPATDLFMPCNAAFMPEDVRTACYTSLTQRFVTAIDATHYVPPPETYGPAMAFCKEAPDAESRTACYGGFGKEYVFYATQWEGSEVTTLSDESLMTIHSWCALAADAEGERRCDSIAVDTLFWAGQNNPRAALSFCRVAPSRGDRNACYRSLAFDVQHFLPFAERLTVCSQFPTESKALCTAE